MHNILVNGDFSAGLDNWLAGPVTNPETTTLALDSAVYDAMAPSVKCTRSATTSWTGVHQRATWLGTSRVLRFSVRLLIPTGRVTYWDAAAYDDDWHYLRELRAIVIPTTGAWQTAEGEFVLPPGVKNFDWGVFFDDATPTGISFNMDNAVVFASSDPGPPSLVIPPETTYSDIERDLIDNEPPGLFPGDQVSIWGQVRKVFADYMQYNLADVLGKWYLNLDPSTVDVGDLPEWEYMLDTPANDALSDAARRSFLISRREQGAFTRSRRARLVESFITPTFGPATDFDPSGIPIDAGGISLYSGITSLAGAYTIREPMDNLIPNANGSFETDVSGWGTDGTTIARSTAAAQYGAASGLVTCTRSTDAWVYAFPIRPVPGRAYSASYWIRRVSGARLASFRFYYQNDDASLTGVATAPFILPPTGSFVQQKLENVFVPDWATYMYWIIDFQTGTMAVGDSFYIDGAMWEAQPTARSYVDAAANPFSYDVRILNTITVDTAGLTRELKRLTPSGISFTITSTATP